MLKRDGGFADVEAAKMAARDDAKIMKNSRLRRGFSGQAREDSRLPARQGQARQPNGPDVGRIMVGQNGEKATRY